MGGFLAGETNAAGVRLTALRGFVMLAAVCAGDWLLLGCWVSGSIYRPLSSSVLLPADGSTVSLAVNLFG